jgi:hypothetical protein
VWQMLGGFQEGIQQAPDYDMWVRVSNVSPVGFLAEKTMELRDHPLQLAKEGQKSLATIEEEIPIYKALITALKKIVSEKELTSYWLRHRGCQHAHWLVRTLLRGNINTFVQGWQYLNQYNPPFRQMLFWLLSLNGRMFCPSGSVFFDKVLKSKKHIFKVQ